MVAALARPLSAQNGNLDLWGVLAKQGMSFDANFTKGKPLLPADMRARSRGAMSGSHSRREDSSASYTCVGSLVSRTAPLAIGTDWPRWPLRCDDMTPERERAVE